MGDRRWSEGERRPWDADDYRRGSDERGDWSRNERYPDVGESESYDLGRFARSYGSGRPHQGGRYGPHQGGSYGSRYGGGYGGGGYDRDFNDRNRGEPSRSHGGSRVGRYGRNYGVGQGSAYGRNYGAGQGSDYGRNYRNYGRYRGPDEEWRYGQPSGYDRGYGRFGWGRDVGASGRSDPGQRSWWDRAKDEMRSWEPRQWRGPRGYRRSDERILEDVSYQLGTAWSLDAIDIEVSVANAEVTLNGTVDSRWAKRRAEDITDGVFGVTHVQNNLRVRASGQQWPGAVGAASPSAGASSSSVSGDPLGSGSASGPSSRPADPRARH
jgi:BON domain